MKRGRQRTACSAAGDMALVGCRWQPELWLCCYSRPAAVAVHRQCKMSHFLWKESHRVTTRQTVEPQRWLSRCDWRREWGPCYSLLGMVIVILSCAIDYRTGDAESIHNNKKKWSKGGEIMWSDWTEDTATVAGDDECCGWLLVFNTFNTQDHTVFYSFYNPERIRCPIYALLRLYHSSSWK